MVPWRDVLTVHPAADLFPLMGDAELRELGEDIKKNGLRNRVAVIEGPDDEPILIDGRNRLDAMELVGLEIVLEDVAIIACCRKHGPGFNPYDYVISANIHRRHLTAEQKRDLIAKLLKEHPERSDRATAELVKVDHKTVSAVRRNEEQLGRLPQLTKRTGKDGKARPATKLPEKATVPKKPGAVATSAKADDRPIDDKQVDGILVHSALMNLIHALGTTEPETVAAFVWPDEICELRDEVETIRNWLDRFIALLPKKLEGAARRQGEGGGAQLMSRAAQTFKQGNLTKAIKAVEKAGLKVQRAEVRQDGSIILDFNGTPIAMSGTVDDLDSELAEFEARHGQG